jgi:Arc/MetJ-type ribon-helix-helix transcriptional regulator
MSSPKKGRRVTISLTEIVAQWADEMCELKGYDNFSAYVADLIRRDKERQEDRELRKQKTSAYQSGQDERMLMEDRPAPPPKKKSAA